MNEEQVKKGIQDLIDDFKANYQQYSKESEASVETKLVEPLFLLLGWTKNDFEKQAKAQRDGKFGHADYAFKIGDKIVFYLEVKRVGVPLEREADKQVISYALSKRVSFAVSTNFEELKIFCVEQENALQNKFRVFNSPNDYISSFNDLLFLSKESFEQGLILKKSESEGRLKRRNSIDKSLLEDLMHMRSLIASDIEKSYPGKYEINEKDEIIQRIIDRLIFVRRCEDTGINPENLTLKEIQELPNNKAYPKLKEIFKKYNDVYNSGLFAIAKDNDCDKILIDGEIIKKLTQYLYDSKNGQYIYNFGWIDADVLGQVYEQYLGKLLAQTKSGKTKLTNGQAHRKEQGIYYTPTYIVDYIVKNTVGELLKNKKTKVKDLKILDPACGSGSFLIKAFDYLYNNQSDSKESKQYRIDSQGKYSIKTEILKNNLYGVDLDNKAVEITKLNLLLKAAEKDRRLPEEIDVHIKHGNSLIDDETIAGLNAFSWEEEFADIMNEGGFDVAIGNPPYVRPENVPRIERDYYLNSKKYEKFFGRFDLYILFIEKALKLLKEDGYFSFIVPHSFLNQNYSKLLRDWILREFKILRILDLSEIKVFESAVVNTCIIVLQKTKPRGNSKIKIVKPLNLSRFNESKSVQISQEFFLSIPQSMIRTDLDEDKIKILKNISKNTIAASEIFYIVIGSVPHDSKTGESKDRLISETKKGESYKPYVEGKDMFRYELTWRNIFLDYQPKLMHRPKFPELFENEKLIVRNISTKDGLLGAYDHQFFYTNDSVSLCVPWYKLKNVGIKGENITKEKITNSEKYNLLYCLGLINSKLLNFYFKNILSCDLHVYPEAIRNLPIKTIPEPQQQQLIKLVDKMLSLNRRLNEIGDKKTSESAKLEDEIRKTDNEIDQLVYKLYGLTKEEISIVEESLKA